MTVSLLQILIFLTLGIAVIVVLTAKYRVHAVFALLIACFIVGLGIHMPVADVVATAKDGFGNIMKSLGLIIILGTTLGILLEHTGSTQALAAFIIKKTGPRYAALAMSITGFVAGLPIFCDSGYLVLNGLNLSLARKTRIPVTVMSISLATGLFAVHCLVPPHPGATAAAATIGADMGKLLLTGILVAVPAMLAGHYWAVYAGRRIPLAAVQEQTEEGPVINPPRLFRAVLPVMVPILLIAARSFAVAPGNTAFWAIVLSTLGDPVIALAAGVLLAFAAGRRWPVSTTGRLLAEAAEKAGGILVIIGAGGAFGAILAAAGIGKHFSGSAGLAGMGILFPFLITAILKTAQGSSTVAIITAATIVQPLLPVLGLNGPNGQLLCVLAMGAGSMMLSHANDAYFWVIAKFSGIEMGAMLKVYSTATALMALVSLLMVWLLSFFLV